MAGPNDVPEYVTVICPTCRARLYERAGREPRQARCPDCFVMVPVPSLDSVLAGRLPERPKEEVGTYSLALPTQEVESPARPKSEPQYVTVFCPHCRARLTPEAKRRPRQVACPDCYELVDVPAADETHRKRRKRKRPPDEPGEYSVPSPVLPERTVTYSSHYLKVEAEVRTEPPPPVPRRTFFTGVFSYPWRPDAVVRWAYLSAGCIVVGLLVTFILNLWSDGMLIALPFFVLPLIWLGLWTVSYAAACTVAILEDTAAGNDVVTNWPDPNWREWGVQLMYLTYMAIVAGFAGYAVGMGVVAAVGEGGWFWPPFFGTTFLLFPVVLMSSLAGGSPWATLSWPIVRSLWSVAWAWAVFYGLAAALWACYLVPVLVGWRGEYAYLATFLTGPLLASAVFIYARLLGRLGWRITTWTQEEITSSRAR